MLGLGFNVIAVDTMVWDEGTEGRIVSFVGFLQKKMFVWRARADMDRGEVGVRLPKGDPWKSAVIRNMALMSRSHGNAASRLPTVCGRSLRRASVSFSFPHPLALLLFT